MSAGAWVFFGYATSYGVLAAYAAWVVWRIRSNHHTAESLE